MDNKEKPEKNDAYIWRIGGFIALAVFILWLSTPSIISWLIPTAEDISAARGQFGDLYGSINALFSGWAFVGVIVAILLQKQELIYNERSLKRQEKNLRNRIKL